MSAVAPTVLAHVGPLGQIAAVVAVAGLAGLYLAGCHHGGRVPPRPAVVAAVVAAGAYLAAASPPVAARADASFAWHMAQHLLLVAVVPPLLVLARPGGPLGAGLGTLAPSASASVRAAGRRASASGTLTVVAALVAAAVLWAWHVPVLYEAAVGSEVLHATEHATLLGSAVAVWVLATGRRTPHQAGLAALLVVALAGSTLGALLTFAPRPLYAVHAAGDPLVDQQWAGVLMWVPGGVVPLAAASALAVDWIRTATRRVELRERVRTAATSRAALVVAVGLAAGAAVTACGSSDDGDAAVAREHIEQRGCAACHRIPGVAGDARVGPSLHDYGRQRYIAGSLVNTPENLARWIQHPQEVEPGTAMPDLGLSEAEAEAIADYLLQQGR